MKKLIILTTVLFLLIFTQDSFASTTYTSSITRAWQGLLIPAYFDPDTQASDWWKLNSIAQKWTPLIAIANPNSWPWKKKTSSYSQAISSLKNSGWKVIGYVSTSYGSRSLKKVISDINKWNKFYQIDGIFIDEMSNNPTKKELAYYRVLYKYIKKINPQWIIVGNPGTSTDKLFFNYVDIMVTFESDQKDYLSSIWEQNNLQWVPFDAQATLIYGVTDFQSVNSVISTRNSWWIYVTSRTLDSNPWWALEPTLQ